MVKRLSSGGSSRSNSRTPKGWLIGCLARKLVHWLKTKKTKLEKDVGTPSQA